MQTPFCAKLLRNCLSKCNVKLLLINLIKGKGLKLLSVIYGNKSRAIKLTAFYSIKESTLSDSGRSHDTVIAKAHKNAL